MVYGSSAISNMNAASFAMNGYGGGRLALPVSRSSYIYSHFEHVSGVPAPEGTRGVAISKLKILDVLIDQLSQIKSKREPSIGASGELTDERIDVLIDKYEQEIRGARAANSIMPYLPKPSAPLGAVFNLVA